MGVARQWAKCDGCTSNYFIGDSAMDIALWIAQVLLAVAFVAAGVNHYRGDDRGRLALAPFGG
jgi:hypothetical protein